jgi:hypothetical protein
MGYPAIKWTFSVLLSDHGNCLLGKLPSNVSKMYHTVNQNLKNDQARAWYQQEAIQPTR